jgi:hypothetical protein
MDLYPTMQFLATAAFLAGVGGIAWSFWAWSSPGRPGALLSETRAVVRVLAALAVICTSLALAVGMRLFGLAVVLGTLRANASLFLWSLLIASVGSSGLGVWAGRQQEREREKAERGRSLAEQAPASTASEPRGPEEEPPVVIQHRRTRKVLWRMAAADLRRADLRGATLAGARFDAATRWPVGFDPETHGAVRLS